MKYTLKFNAEEEQCLQQLADRLGVSKDAAVQLVVDILVKIVRENPTFPVTKHKKGDL